MDNQNENAAVNQQAQANREAFEEGCRDALQLKAYWEGVTQGREQASVIQIRLAALQLAHIHGDSIHHDVDRAREYHAFLIGEKAAL